MEDLLAEARRRRIVERVRHAGTARVADLAAELAVTEETVRRDLKLLDRQGVLTRTHGGAVPNASAAVPRGIEESFEHRRRQMLAAKRAIAAEAARRIDGPLTIALDGSTTAWELAAILAETPDVAGLTVVTNSLMVTTLLAARAHPQVISVGGTLDRKLMLFTGMIASAGLRHLHVDLFFCSCGGIDAGRGFSDPSESSAEFKRQFMRVADRTIVLADSTKFAMRAPVLFAKPTDVVELITDVAAPSDAIDSLTAVGLPSTRVVAD